ncbi:hypothetical protein GWD52_11200 [Enterobacteriaceae bacterium 4M9]|nr:hypothetical protein [Enterobacteriaceae bacterium 4M9]
MKIPNAEDCVATLADTDQNVSQPLVKLTFFLPHHDVKHSPSPKNQAEKLYAGTGKTGLMA